MRPPRQSAFWHGLEAPLRRPRLTLGLWLLLLLVSAFAAKMLPQPVLTESTGARDSEAYAVMQALRQDFHFHLGNTLALIVEGPAPAALIQQLPAEFPELQRIEKLPMDSPAAASVQRPPLQVYLFHFSADFEFVQAQAWVQALRARLRQAQEQNQDTDAARAPPWQFWLSGNLAFYADILAAGQHSLSQNEYLALGAALVVLLLSLGGLWAAVLPILLGLSSIFCFQAFARLIGLPSTPMSASLSALLGLALALDYGLFWIGRYREERQQGRDQQAALQESARTAGKTLAVSGAIVWVSLAVLLIPDVSGLRILALNLLGVIAFSLLHALLILPAVLSWSAAYLERPRALSRWLARYDSHALWRRYLVHITAHPLRYFLVSMLGFGGLCWPLLQMKIWDPVQTLASPESESVRGYQRLVEYGLGGRMVPLYVLVEAPVGERVDGSEGLAYIAALTRELQADPGVEQVVSLSSWQRGLSLETQQRLWEQFSLLQDLSTAFQPEAPRMNWLSADRRKHVIQVFPRDIMDVAASHALSDRVRRFAQRAQHTGEAPADFRVLTGGVVERARDFSRAMYAPTPLMLALVLLGVFVILVFYLKSLVLPLKAAVMNFFPILGAFGILTAIYQWGWGSEFFQTPQNGAISSLIPMTLFCLTFGLSMDYEVLILSRIAENVRRGQALREAVIEGMARSGAVITSAVLIFLILFLPACFSSSPALKELGMGIVAALILDATLLRLLLVPSLMLLLGRWNWWLPGQRHI